ncbi:MAG: 50S ribosomal protein L22 [Armatimonadetes bacterium]|nr:50S ribosomal protein L22 [Armatimonadota bacterium]
MEVKATAKYIRVQPRKVRIIADQVKGQPAVYAASLLRYHTSKSAKALRKVLVSAVANAVENHQLDEAGLKISRILVDQGPVLKRMKARAQGRGNRIIKKQSHITVVVEDAEVPKTVKPHGTKAKPRPTLAGKPGKKAAAPKAAKATKAEATPAEEVVVEPVVEETAAAAEETKEEGAE